MDGYSFQKKKVHKEITSHSFKDKRKTIIKNNKVFYKPKRGNEKLKLLGRLSNQAQYEQRLRFLPVTLKVFPRVFQYVFAGEFKKLLHRKLGKG